MKIKALAEHHGKDFALYNADCVDFARQMPSNSVHFSVYSPPFANLYCYSDSARDMGNCEDDAEFFVQYGYLVREMHRVLKPGRLVAVHCKDLVNYKSSSGMAGLRDFPGDIIRLHQEAGFAFHSRITIWKCPVTEMQRTKAHGLLYKQIRRDSTFSRQGLADYLLIFRKWGTSETPVATDSSRTDEILAERDAIEAVTHTHDSFSLDAWQQYASPVWMDVDQTNVLNVQRARENKDEKHMCPLQLDVIERALALWTNPGDVVFSPFAGVGSEGYGALMHGRKFVGTELKRSYYEWAIRFLEEAAKGDAQIGLFSNPASDPRKSAVVSAAPQSWDDEHEGAA